MANGRAPQPVYYALVVPGLESVAAAELTAAGACVGDVLLRFDRRDSLLIFTAPDLNRVLHCGTIEDIFQLIFDAPTPGGPRAAKLLSRSIERPALERAMATHHAVRPKNRGRSFKVVARVAGRQSFRRAELAPAFEAALHSLLPRWRPTGEAAAIELWVHVIGERTIAGLRLSGDELAQRRYKRHHLAASLKPTVARALVLLSEPVPNEVVLDPMCGAGTILRERSDYGPARTIGGDLDSEAVAAARINVGRGAGIARWDATRLPLQSASVDAVVTNPPYGRQHEAVGGIDRLYARSLREIARVLRPDRRCVLLTGEPDALSRALPPSLRVRKKLRCIVRGLSVTAFVMDRL